MSPKEVRVQLERRLQRSVPKSTVTNVLWRSARSPVLPVARMSRGQYAFRPDGARRIQLVVRPEGDQRTTES